jgi:hypothetical protein
MKFDKYEDLEDLPWQWLASKTCVFFPSPQTSLGPTHSYALDMVGTYFPFLQV